VRALFGRVAGLAAIVFLVAVVAAVPGLNLVALGYLLEAEGRIGRGARWQEALPLWSVAPRLAATALLGWLWLLPLRALHGLWFDARLIEAEGGAARALGIAFYALLLLVGAHLGLALLAGGGRARAFFRPLENLRRARDRALLGAELARELAAELHPLRWLALGARGFAGAFAWLVIPSALLASAARTPALTVAGGVLMLPVAAWLPFLQARFAQQDRLGAFLEWREVRTLFRRAPLTWLTAALATYVLTLPLYLLKILVPPADAAWLLTLVFTASILPVKLITGWAYRRAIAAEAEAHAALTWSCRVALAPALAAYVVLLFLTRWIDAHGAAGLFAQHAFLLPAPF
jgi:hypothetical protein